MAVSWRNSKDVRSSFALPPKKNLLVSPPPPPSPDWMGSLRCPPAPCEHPHHKTIVFYHSVSPTRLRATRGRGLCLLF